MLVYFVWISDLHNFEHGLELESCKYNTQKKNLDVFQK